MLGEREKKESGEGGFELTTAGACVREEALAHVVRGVALVRDPEQLDVSAAGVDGATAYAGDVVEKSSVDDGGHSVFRINRSTILKWEGLKLARTFTKILDQFLTVPASQPLKTMSTIVIEPNTTLTQPPEPVAFPFASSRPMRVTSDSYA